MTDDLDPTAFRRRYFADRDDLVAASWWQDNLHPVTTLLETTTRRNALAVVGGGAAAVVLVALIKQEPSEPLVSTDALELQRRLGWNIGASGRALVFSHANAVDEAGRSDWNQHLESLPGEMAPTQSALLPFYVPTLFQVVSAADFRNDLWPVHTPEMDVARARAQGLADMFAGTSAPRDTALVIDMPGPDAVAAAAGLADTFEPVFLFDNWPHPRGVVPSHEAIGAAVFLRPSLEAAQTRRPPDAPPAFVLDSLRLGSYRDDGDAFDNRYLARLPSAAALQRLGIRHLLYVTGFQMSHEADDLNDDFVAFANAGVDVKLLALSDFRQVALDPGAGTTMFTYGGSPAPRVWFWRAYLWHPAPAMPAGASPPLGVADGAAFRPVARTTIFSSRTVGGLSGFGKQKPSGFGRVSYGKSTGTVYIGRSGSLGRARFSYGG